MSSRTSITAALALAAATILAIAACGSSVTGSAQANSAAVLTTTAPSTESTSEISLPSELTDASALPTDLSGLTSLLDELPTDLSLPSDLSDLTNLDIPGYSGACVSVSLAYLAVTLAPFATLAGGGGNYDAADLQKAFEELKTGTEIPAEIAPDIQAIQDIAQKASGGSIADAGALFQSEEFATASANISKWLETNCNG